MFNLLFLKSTSAVLIWHHCNNLQDLLIHASGYMRFSWVIPAMVFMIVFSVSYFKFLNSLPRKYEIGFILSFFYVAGAIGFEMISAKLFINNASSARSAL